MPRHGDLAMKKRRSSAAPERNGHSSMEKDPSYYTFVSSRFGDVGIVWYDGGGGPRIHRIFLPSERSSMSEFLEAHDSGARRRSCPAVDDLAARIRELCSGHAVTFDLARFDLDRCPRFQRRVLLAEFGIPRGRVSTYGRIARHIGHPGAARAAGSALGANPYPLVIPCHRAIRETGDPGGYRGGSAMKRTLLELEGIEFSASGRVIMNALFY